MPSILQTHKTKAKRREGRGTGRYRGKVREREREGRSWGEEEKKYGMGRRGGKTEELTERVGRMGVESEEGRSLWGRDKRKGNWWGRTKTRVDKVGGERKQGEVEDNSRNERRRDGAEVKERERQERIRGEGGGGGEGVCEEGGKGRARGGAEGEETKKKRE